MKSFLDYDVFPTKEQIEKATMKRSASRITFNETHILKAEYARRRKRRTRIYFCKVIEDGQQCKRGSPRNLPLPISA